MRVTKQPKRPFPPKPALLSDDDVLNYLCCFLNLDLSGKTREQIFRWVEQEAWSKFSWVGPKMSPKAARSLQKELIKDLSFLLPEEDDRRSEGLRDLTRKINAMNLKFEWYLERDEDYTFVRKHFMRTGGPILKARRPITLGKSRWIVRRKFLNSETPRRRLYSLIINSVEDQEIEFLKRCPQCLRFHTVKDSGHIYCSDKCRYDFHNERKDFKKIRRKKREYLLRRAHDLQKAGKLKYVIAERTGLGPRILKRAGIA